ncbi:hypothetical protein E2C01_027959 [Portunus trituberculatus]|uniref:Uncharacterized protein n=1 Tax=Portunus trituberculatus TaxID=210409 RepID=A0A5B7EMR8_PORTR|nr:hypothetical protein [Portunus trituberculatus]
MQKEFSKKKRQTIMLQFFKKTPVEDVVLEEDVDDPMEAAEAEEVQVDDDILDLEVESNELVEMHRERGQNMYGHTPLHAGLADEYEY